MAADHSQFVKIFQSRSMRVSLTPGPPNISDFGFALESRQPDGSWVVADIYPLTQQGRLDCYAAFASGSQWPLPHPPGWYFNQMRYIQQQAEDSLLEIQ